MPNLPLMDDIEATQSVDYALRELWSYTPTGTAAKVATATRYVADGLSSASMQTRAGLGYNANFNASAILERKQEYDIQVIATTFSSCSILAALCAVYWFCMMRRNFRRDLVLLLICGDLFKAIWFLVISTLSLSIGKDVPTSSPVCQASGYFLQACFEACDVAILLMSLHMQLQIFPPSESFLGHGGLYRIRKYALSAWFIIPNIMASLAFANSKYAYVSQGGFCTLPIRPFWYRLALSWIPRYLIWIYILFVAVKIYRHVGYEFKVFGQEKDGSSSLPDTSPANTKPSEVMVPMQRSQSAHSAIGVAEKQQIDNIAPDEESMTPASPTGKSPYPKSKGREASRRQSVPNWSIPFGGRGLDHMEQSAELEEGVPRSKSNPSSRRGSGQISATGVESEDFAPAPVPPPPIVIDRIDRIDRHRGSVSTMASMKSSGAHSSYDQPLDTITEGRTSMASANSATGNVANKLMKKRRRAIQRQLRLLFIYPVCYMAMWLIPFVKHCLNYSNYYAQHPIFALSALSIFCQTSMGYVDVIIFCWREKPWRHVPGSDGTFLGSFCFWRYAFAKGFSEARRKSSAPLQEKERSVSQSGLLNSLKRWSMSFSGKPASPQAPKASISVAPRTTTVQTTPSKRAAPPPMHRRTHSGGSDRRIMHAEQAAMRLRLERADYHTNRRTLQDRRTSVISTHQQQLESTPTSPTRKEWWDRHMSVTDADADADDLNDDDGNGNGMGHV